MHEHTDYAHRDIAAGNANMYVQPEDDALPGEPGEPFLNAFITLGGKHDVRAAAMKRMSASHRKFIAQGTGNVPNSPQIEHEFLLSLAHISTNASLQLDHRLHQLSRHIRNRFRLAFLQNTHGTRSQVTAVAIDDLKLHLHPERSFR